MGYVYACTFHWPLENTCVLPGQFVPHKDDTVVAFQPHVPERGAITAWHHSHAYCTGHMFRTMWNPPQMIYSRPPVTPHLRTMWYRVAGEAWCGQTSVTHAHTDEVPLAEGENREMMDVHDFPLACAGRTAI